MKVRFLLLLLLPPLLSSCLARQTVDGPPPLENLPPRFSVAAEPFDSSRQWWEDFDSEELNSLVAEAVSENFSVREAFARLSQARYAALKAGAGLWPSVTASGGAGVTERKSEGSVVLDSDDWSLGLSASYELDLWGRVRAEKRGEVQLAGASEEDVKTALLSVSGQIAENWIGHISVRRQRQLFERQLELQRQLLRLITARFQLGNSSALEIFQQQQAIERIEAALIPLDSREEALGRQLAFLLGRATLDADRLLAEGFPALPALPGLGLPAGLLARRPDIRAAGLRLTAGQWDVAAARADLLPAFKLTASHTFASNGLSSLFDNWLRNLAANLTEPLLDGGLRRNEVERQRAIVEERLATYGRTVFTAIREVEDALTEEKQNAETMATLHRQLELSERTITEARRLYLNGSSDFLNVLREELNILEIEQDLITSEEGILIARTRLYRALGGTWMDSYVAEYETR